MTPMPSDNYTKNYQAANEWLHSNAPAWLTDILYEWFELFQKMGDNLVALKEMEENAMSTGSHRVDITEDKTLAKYLKVPELWSVCFDHDSCGVSKDSVQEAMKFAVDQVKENDPTCKRIDISIWPES